MPTYCIMCGKPKSGIPVENDRIIDSIRWFKRNVTKNEQNNNLVVCKEDYPKYKKNRDRYTSRQVIYLALGVIMLLLGLAISSFRFTSLILGLIVVAFMYLLSLMNYTPKLHMKEEITSKKSKHNQ